MVFISYSSATAIYFVLITLVGLLLIGFGIYKLGISFGRKDYKFEVRLLLSLPLLWVYLLVFFQLLFYSKSGFLSWFIALYILFAGTIIFFITIFLLFIIRFIRIRWFMKS